MIKIKFSKIEVIDLFKAWFIISLAFAILISRAGIGIDFIHALLLGTITIGIGFLLHELGHKFVAQRYGCYAEFRANNFMLFIAIILSFIGFLFAAPGAVMIRGRISKERNGKISMAGPAVNIILAIIFLILAFIFTQGFAAIVVGTGIFINILIGGFNLLPVWLFDGKKILAWNKIVYFTMVIVTIGLFVLSYYLDLLPFI